MQGVARLDTHLRQLVERARPGISERHLDRLTGHTRTLRPFDKAALHQSPPATRLVVDLAAALGVDVYEVLEACLVDAGLPVTPDYDRQQHRAARLVGTIPAEGRGAVVDAFEALLRAMPWWRGPVEPG